MKIKDGRGEKKVEDAARNRLMIKNWFNSNPNKTAKQCSIGVGLSYSTVLGHIKKLVAD